LLLLKWLINKQIVGRYYVKGNIFCTSFDATRKEE
jgi:hypothetical protein